MKTIKINGRELVLSPRKIKDKAALNEATPDLAKAGVTPKILVAAQIVNDSLKATYQNMMAGFDLLPFWKKWAVIKKTKDYAIFYRGGIGLIINECDEKVLEAALEDVNELEGYKKKVAEEAEMETAPQQSN